jgi:hypothetical protein
VLIRPSAKEKHDFAVLEIGHTQAKGSLLSHAGFGVVTTANDKPSPSTTAAVAAIIINDMRATNYLFSGVGLGEAVEEPDPRVRMASVEAGQGWGVGVKARFLQER